jgi:hypothetical protein
MMERLPVRSLPYCSIPGATCCIHLPLLQAHEDGHLAAKLQREEEKLGRLFASAGGGPRGGSGGGGGGGKKRPAGGGRQGTLVAAFGKRAKQ